MTIRVARFGMLALAAALALSPVPGAAVAPVLLMMIRQIAQQAAQSMVKDALLSGLSGMGCKGIALSNALAALDLRGGAGGLMGGMPKMPAGMSMPGLPAGIAMPNMPGGMGLPMGMLPPGAGVPADVAAKMGAMMPDGGTLPPGMAIGPGQMAMMARMQQSMSQPLSPAETLATLDELTELGFLPKAMQTELQECMVLVPASVQALGMGMGMLKPMIPQLQQARAQLHALSPADQDEVAATLVQEMKPLPPDQRVALLEHIDSGFFPPRVVEGVKAGLTAR